MNDLRKLSRRVVVFVDDLDRLEPAEAAEMVRLVRAVADFPNIVYVLSYAKPVLAASLSRAMRIESGEAYIEKIVQVSFSVPKPEDFDLRRMFHEELIAVFPYSVRQEGDAAARETDGRLRSIIDFEGRRSLTTPRHVVRVINGLRLYAGAVSDQVDLTDMVWLHLVRARSSELYDWVEEYVNRVAAVAHGAIVPEAESESALARLVDLLREDGTSKIDERMNRLREVLPGIVQDFSSHEGSHVGWKLFANLRQGDFSDLIRGRRLGSPEHFRFYFALSRPGGALEDAEFDGFLASAANDPSRAISQFRELSKRRRPQGGVFAEALLDRLLGRQLDEVSDEALPGVVESLASGLDDAARATGEADFGRYRVWEAGDRLFRTAVTRIPSGRRADLLRSAFESGSALGWLSHIYRGLFFSHSESASRQGRVDSQYLASEEYELIERTILDRYRSADPKEMLRCPHLNNVLFAWAQSGEQGAVDASEWVAQRCATDEGFLDLLERMRGWTAVNGHVIHPLRESNVSHVMDFQEMKQRLHDLGGSGDSVIADRARELSIAVQQGEND